MNTETGLSCYMNLKLRSNIQAVCCTGSNTDSCLMLVRYTEIKLTTNGEVTFPPLVNKDIVKRNCSAEGLYTDTCVYHCGTF